VDGMASGARMGTATETTDSRSEDPISADAPAPATGLLGSFPDRIAFCVVRGVAERESNVLAVAREGDATVTASSGGSCWRS